MSLFPSSPLPEVSPLLHREIFSLPDNKWLSLDRVLSNGQLLKEEEYRKEKRAYRYWRKQIFLETPIFLSRRGMSSVDERKNFFFPLFPPKSFTCTFLPIGTSYDKRIRTHSSRALLPNPITLSKPYPLTLFLFQLILFFFEFVSLSLSGLFRRIFFF